MWRQILQVVLAQACQSYCIRQYDLAAEILCACAGPTGFPAAAQTWSNPCTSKPHIARGACPMTLMSLRPESRCTTAASGNLQLGYMAMDAPEHVCLASRRSQQCADMKYTAPVHGKQGWTAPDKSINIDFSIECCWDAVISPKRNHPESRPSSKGDELTVSMSLRRLGKPDSQKVQTKVPWSLIHSATCRRSMFDVIADRPWRHDTVTQKQ